jgi:hypothetical protein
MIIAISLLIILLVWCFYQACKCLNSGYYKNETWERSESKRPKNTPPPPPPPSPKK